MKRAIYAGVLAVMTCLSGAAVAEGIDGCALGPKGAKEVISPLLAGKWKAANGAGVIILENASDQVTEGVPAQGHENIEIVWQDGVLLAGLKRTDADPSTEVMPLSKRPAKFGIKFGDEVKVLDGAMTGGFNCQPSDLPLVAMGGTVRDADGAERSYRFTLHVISQDLMSGVMTIEAEHLGTKAHISRLVTLTRM